VVWIFRVGFGVAGGLFTFIGVRLVVKAGQLKKHGLRTVGTVIGVKRSYHYEGLFFHFPIVKFTTESGKIVEFKSSIGDAQATYKVGDQIPVIYHQQQPEKAEIESSFRLQKAPVIFLSAGIFFLVSCLFTFR